MSNCRKYDEADFAALTAGDLPRPKAWAMRRHLARCPECRAESEAVAGLWRDAAASAHAAVTVPDTLADGTWRLTAALITGPVRPVRAGVSRRNLLVGGAALAAGAASVAGLLALPGSPARPVPVFARVEQAMGQVQTASWVESTYYGEEKKASVTEGRCWLRTMPEPAVVRQSNGVPGGMVTLTNRYGNFSYTPKGDDYMVWEHGDRTAEAIRSALYFPRTYEARRDVARRADAKDAPYKHRTTPWAAERVTWQGRPALRFTSRSTRYRDDTAWWRRQTPQEYESVVYADPETFRILRSEWRQTGGIPGRSVTIRHSFRYNVTPPSGVFDILPPVGKRVAVMDWSLVDARVKSDAEDEVTAVERSAVLAAVRRTQDAWNRGDWSAYEATRDFSYETPLWGSTGGAPPERRQSARAALEGHTPWRRFRVVDRPRVSAMSRYWLTRRSEDEPFPGPTPRDTFEVAALLRAVPAEGGAEVRRPGYFTVHRNENGVYRVAAVRFVTKPAPPPMTPRQAYEVGARGAMGAAKPSGTVTRPAGRR